MAGKLSGFYFKQVVNALMNPNITLRKYAKHIENMRDDGWYDWDEYIEIVNEIAQKLSPRVLENIGRDLVTQSKPLFVQQGFDTPDKILEDYYALFSANIKGAPAKDEVHTVSYEAGHAIIEAGLAQPTALVKGYLRGIVEMFDQQIQSFTCEEVKNDKGFKVNRMELTWN
ncbi:hypothetical protein U27_06250 [Candidatus Vecturithrix granuli]|uniref:Heme NO-binding domain-containing protein n=1 Tax=Vecturithrix granuli TaxID=1499967 RepID=A0A081C3W8_VECG1|nr:hypothetical protein U27_06250 [Candidatus Vecturithrix granuli]